MILLNEVVSFKKLLSNKLKIRKKFIAFTIKNRKKMSLRYFMKS